MGPVEKIICEKLDKDLWPEVLEVTNESFMHSVPPNSETHFKAVVVSSFFTSKRQVQRHQLIYKILAHELAGGVHALALHTYSPVEWSDRAKEVPDSPNCLGASAR